MFYFDKIDMYRECRKLGPNYFKHPTSANRNKRKILKLCLMCSNGTTFLPKVEMKPSIWKRIRRKAQVCMT